MIDFGLSEDQTLIQQTARQFAREVLRPQLRAVEAAGRLPEAALSSWAAVGLSGLNLPERVGGAALGLLTTALAVEELAVGDVAAAWALPGLEPAAIFVGRLGDAAQQDRWLAPYAERAGWCGATALADDPAAPLTGRAVEGGWRLEGRKIAVERAPLAGYLVVAAALEGRGPSWVIVAADAPGVVIEARAWKLGLAATPTAAVRFEGVQIDAAAVAGQPDALLGAWLDVAIHAAALHLGAARAAHEVALTYTQEREAFGKPVAHFQAVAFALADAAMAIDAGRWMLWRAAAARDSGKLAISEVVGALLQCHEAAVRVCDEGVQLLGGAGYIQDHPVEKWMRDQQTLSLCGVTPEAAEEILTRVALGEPVDAGDFGQADGAQAPLL